MKCASGNSAHIPLEGNSFISDSCPSLPTISFSIFSDEAWCDWIGTQVAKPFFILLQKSLAHAHFPLIQIAFLCMLQLTKTQVAWHGAVKQTNQTDEHLSPCYLLSLRPKNSSSDFAYLWVLLLFRYHAVCSRC